MDDQQTSTIGEPAQVVGLENNLEETKDGSEQQNKKENKNNPFEDPTSNIPSKEKVLKVYFTLLLFIVVVGCGIVARVTLHILIWHINPPNSSDNSLLNTFGGLLKNNCTVCSEGAANVTGCATNEQESTIIDDTWIWAVFLVIIAPYVLTFMSAFCRICFKSNAKLNYGVLLVVIIIETCHSVGISILVFFVLPSFDPASASIVYLAVAVLPPFLDIIDKVTNDRRRVKVTNDEQTNTTNEKLNGQTSAKWLKRILCNENSRCSIVYPIVGLILQIIGIVLILFYINNGWLRGMFVLAVLLVSTKHWDNFITIAREQDDTLSLRQIKLIYQKGKTRITCLANLWKIIITFLSVIAIFTIRTTDSLSGFKSLFNSGKSTLNSVFGEREIGDSMTCQDGIPFKIAAINIVSDYVCYKAAKTACAIFTQRLGLFIPMLLLPVVTTFTLVGLMVNPDILKFDSCDLLFTEWCLKSIDGIGTYYLELILSFVFLYLSIPLITRHVWRVNGYRQGETSRIFVSPFYCGVFLDLSLLLNRRRLDTEYDIVLKRTKKTEKPKKTENPEKTKTPKKTEKTGSERIPDKPVLFACATMWHENENEITKLLESIFRLDDRQFTNRMLTVPVDNNNEFIENPTKNNEDTDGVIPFDLKVDVFFDDAFDAHEDKEKGQDFNSYVKTFIDVFYKVGRLVHQKGIKPDDISMYRTPYGAKLEWKLPGGNDLVVHLKNKKCIRHKKRWSQVMYIFYNLKWRLKSIFGRKGMETAAYNAYILALDGDVDFEPEAVLSLMRRMQKSDIVGAACGRIHPIGSGPMVWYQKFEYAISHWLQKAAEHVTGCVLCSPGCFSLFRCAALLKADVYKTYTHIASEPEQHIQYDQGEDRWLCTLLLKEGWKIEYCAESDAKTFAPEGFYEFYKQRRRWTPSTMANIIDLITDFKKVTKENENISFPYIVYQVMLLISTLLTPGTIFLLIVGAIIVAFPAVPPWLTLVLNIIPVGIFILMCLYASNERQLQFAAILSAVYTIIMMLVLIGIVRDAVQDGFCSMTTIFILFVVGVFVISAVLHPQEILDLIPWLLYFVAIPSMSMLMFFYAVGNLHIVNSWGTRETTQETKTEGSKHKPEREETGYFCSLGNFLSVIFCPRNTYTKDDLIYENMKERVNPPKPTFDDSTNVGRTNNGDDQRTREYTDIDGHTNEQQTETTGRENDDRNKNEELSDEIHYYTKDIEGIPSDEEKFWKKIIKKYLKPLKEDKTNESAMQTQLIDLRNRVCLFVFLLNALLVTVIYALTQINAFSNSLSIRITCRGTNVDVVPISILFVLVFGLLLLIQFLCMLYHRFSTLIHIIAETDFCDSENKKKAKLMLDYAKYLKTPIISKPPIPDTMDSDKDRNNFDKNRSLNFPRHQERVAKIDDIVNSNIQNTNEEISGTSMSESTKNKSVQEEKLKITRLVIAKFKNMDKMTKKWHGAVDKLKDLNKRQEEWSEESQERNSANDTYEIQNE